MFLALELSVQKITVTRGKINSDNCMSTILVYENQPSNFYFIHFPFRHCNAYVPFVLVFGNKVHKLGRNMCKREVERGTHTTKRGGNLKIVKIGQTEGHKPNGVAEQALPQWTASVSTTSFIIHSIFTEGENEQQPTLKISKKHTKFGFAPNTESCLFVHML